MRIAFEIVALERRERHRCEEMVLMFRKCSVSKDYARFSTSRFQPLRGREGEGGA